MEIIHLDHVYLSVSNFPLSEKFYDSVMQSFGFKKGNDPIDGEQHAHYFNREIQISLRPARTQKPYDSYAPGLHHICLQVASRSEINVAAKSLKKLGVDVSDPKEYPEYSDDYYAIFFKDPDGIRFELVARTKTRDLISLKWPELKGFLNPASRLMKQENA